MGLMPIPIALILGGEPESVELVELELMDSVRRAARNRLYSE
jgi:hypothetical protein